MAKRENKKCSRHVSNKCNTHLGICPSILPHFLCSLIPYHSKFPLRIGTFFLSVHTVFWTWYILYLFNSNTLHWRTLWAFQQAGLLDTKFRCVIRCDYCCCSLQKGEEGLTAENNMALIFHSKIVKLTMDAQRSWQEVGIWTQYVKAQLRVYLISRYSSNQTKH